MRIRIWCVKARRIRTNEGQMSREGEDLHIRYILVLENLDLSIELFRQSRSEFALLLLLVNPRRDTSGEVFCELREDSRSGDV